MHGFRVLLTPRWLGIAAATLAAAAIMVVLGFWQLSRYHERSAINAGIDAATAADPTPVDRWLRPGQPAPAGAQWQRVTATGTFDTSHEILVRGRTVADRVGFEVLTPLVDATGTAVLVNRGWIPPAPQGLAVAPAVPGAPPGVVTVTGRVRLPESRRGAVDHRGDRIEVRRIDPAQLAGSLPYPLLGGWLAADPVGEGFVAVPVDHVNSAMNAGYVVQWWAFALLALTGYVILARRAARAGVSGDTADQMDMRS